jgi:hypothetical protein
VLVIDEKEYAQTVRIDPDPNVGSEPLLNADEYTDGWRTDHEETRRKQLEK